MRLQTKLGCEKRWSRISCHWLKITPQSEKMSETYIQKQNHICILQRQARYSGQSWSHERFLLWFGGKLIEKAPFFRVFFFVRGSDEKMQFFWRCSYTQETLTDQTRVFAFLLRRKISRRDRFPWKALILAMIWNCGTSLMELQIYYF